MDCQPLQSFARLSECRDQSFWSLEKERENMKKVRKRDDMKKKKTEQRLADIQMLEYTHNTHRHTH